LNSRGELSSTIPAVFRALLGGHRRPSALLHVARGIVVLAKTRASEPAAKTAVTGGKQQAFEN